MSIYEQHKPNKGGGDYLKLKAGDRVKVRFASEPAGITYDGEKLRYQWVVYNHDEKKAQVYEAGAQVFGQLSELYPDWGDPQEFDVSISRTGSGQFDTTYTVTPSPKSVPLSKEQKDAVADALTRFPGSKAKWLSEIEADGTFPEPIIQQPTKQEDSSFDESDIPDFG